ncbi:MAG: hypothetical protein ABI806_06350 [Candidatus Solibacter sp.]
MKKALGVAAISTPGPRKNRIAFEDILRLRIGALVEERDALDEEVRQLRAAVQIYSEVVRRLEVSGPQRVA